jgi:hypothetical protein
MRQPLDIGGPALYYAAKYTRALRRMRRGGGRGRGTAFGFSVVKVNLDKAQLRLILNTPAGNLWHALDRRGRAIVRDAKKQVGVDTGALRQSIHMKHIGNVTGQYLRIGSNKSYAYMHHQGTRPHTITPKEKPLLVFRSGARIIRTPIVAHPGTRANRYLTTPMRRNLIRPIRVR